MAKKSKSNNYAPRTQSHQTTATRSVFLGFTPIGSTPLTKFSGIPNSDRRKFNPTKSTSGPATTIRKAGRLQVAPSRQAKLPHLERFAIPRAVKLCVSRKVRRGVLLALRKGGAKGGRSKKHYNQWSKVKC